MLILNGTHYHLTSREYPLQHITCIAAMCQQTVLQFRACCKQSTVSVFCPGSEQCHCLLANTTILILGSLHAIAACRDPALNATYRNEIIPLSGNVGLLNFTNPQVPGPGSSACALNGATYQDTNVLQEIIGELHELSLWNIDVHPYHHHTQP